MPRDALGGGGGLSRPLLSDPGWGGGLSWASAKAQPPTHPPTHPTLVAQNADPPPVFCPLSNSLGLRPKSVCTKNGDQIFQGKVFALRAHCVCTACALRGHCVRTACTLQ